MLKLMISAKYLVLICHERCIVDFFLLLLLSLASKNSCFCCYWFQSWTAIKGNQIVEINVDFLIWLMSGLGNRAVGPVLYVSVGFVKWTR